VLLAQLEHARSADTGRGDRQTRSDRARAARRAGALDVWRGDPAAGRADARPAEQASPQIRAAIDRASELVKDGLANARQVVGALRGEQLPGVAQLDSLVDSFRDEMNIDMTLKDRGQRGGTRSRGTSSPDSRSSLQNFSRANRHVSFIEFGIVPLWLSGRRPNYAASLKES
jgi:hypothetical protein